MKCKCLFPKVSCFPILSNCTYDVALKKNLFYNNSLMFHDKKLAEKIFETLHFQIVVKSTLRACNFNFLFYLW